MATGNLAHIVEHDLIYKANASDSTFTAKTLALRCTDDGEYIAPASISLASKADPGKGSDGSSSSTSARFMSYGFDYTLGNFANSGTACSDAKSGDGYMLQCLTWVFTATEWSSSTDSYFYLNPVYFTMSSMFFMPTHNSVTNAVSNKDYYYHFMDSTPYYRLENNDHSFTEHPIYFMIACDYNDEFRLGADSNALMRHLKATINTGRGTLHAQSGWVYDNNDRWGHAFSQRDIRLAVHWFSDIFRTATKFGDQPDASTYASKNATESLLTAAWGPCYLFHEYGCAGALASPVSGASAICSSAMTMSAATEAGGTQTIQGMWGHQGYGGLFNPTIACDTSIFVTYGNPMGVYADIIDHVEYMTLGEGMESGPDHDSIVESDNNAMKAYCEGDCTATQKATFASNYNTQACWADYNVKTISKSYTVSQANCCSGSNSADCLAALMAEGYDPTECCNSSELGTMMTDTSSYLVGTYFKGSGGLGMDDAAFAEYSAYSTKAMAMDDSKNAAYDTMMSSMSSYDSMTSDY